MMLRSFFIFIVTFFSITAAVASSEDVQAELLSAIEYFQEDVESPLSLFEAKVHFDKGAVTKAERQFLTFGISNKPVWIRLSLNNTSSHSLRRRLTAGQTWIESLDVYLVDGEGNIKYWHSGDGKKLDTHLLPGIGLVFDIDIPPGMSQVFIRGQTEDPLTLPIQLLDGGESQQLGIKSYVASGVMYGVLLALVGFNLVLFITLKQLYALYYSIYISCFIVMNIGYSGYGFSWLYPNSPWIQNYSTLFFMVLHGVCGLIFVSNFLHLSKHMPILKKAIYLYIDLGLLAIAFSISVQLHLLSSFIAFSYIAMTTLFMIFVGLLNVHRVDDALYFTLGVCSSMVGLLITTLSVWGVIPYTVIGFHSAEIGVLCEAVILAMVVAYRLRSIEHERISAKYLAMHDPLTQLLNRRAFKNTAQRLMDGEFGKDRVFSFVIMDIDHFKVINDTYGHHVGDLALAHIAGLLKGHSRKTDLIARWGGEEMVLLLPETNIHQAIAYTEKLHATIKNSFLKMEGQTISITASFGVASRRHQESLESMLKRADERLYIAKNRGRDQVEPQCQSLVVD